MKKLVLTALAIAGLSQTMGCIISDDEPSDEGTMELAWTVTLNGAAVDSCDEVGAAEVEVLTTDSLGNGLADQFPCNNFQGETFGLVEDTYTVVVSILDANEVALDSFPAETGVPVTAGDVTDLGTYNFEFTGGAPVTASIFVDYGNAGGGATDNCDEGGNGVVQQEIWIFENQTCLDGTSITNAFGTGDACGGRLVCTNIDEVNTASLFAGTYEIQVFGFKGAVGAETYLCYETSPIEFTINADSDVDVVVPFSATADPRCDATKPDRGDTK